MFSRSNFRRIRHSNFAKCLKTLCFVKPPVIEAGYCLGLIEPATPPPWKWKLTCYSFIKCINRDLFFSISQSLTLALDKQSIPRGLASAQQGSALGKLLKTESSSQKTHWREKY